MKTSESIIQTLDLDRFFDESSCRYDLKDGTSHSSGGTRIVYLPEDAIVGIHSALVEETGPAWKLILKNCGVLWGQRVAKNLDRELGLLFNTSQADLPILEFIRMAENYFASHGWGHVKFDLSHTPTHGFIHVTMQNSLFAAVLEQEVEPVDSMLAGVFASLINAHTDCEIDAIEIACTRAGASQCEFIITASERIEKIEDDLEAGKSSTEIMDSLKAS